MYSARCSNVMWENLALTYLATVDLEGKKEKTNFFFTFYFCQGGNDAVVQSKAFNEEKHFLSP